MSLKLGKVSRGPHLPTLVADSLAREIAAGRLKPDDRLPTEQALAAMFGVSRNVVREAIARLASEGRVWSKQGRGAFVSASSAATVLKIDDAALQNVDAFRSLFELRGMLEVQTAAIAAVRRNNGDLDRMRQALAAMAGVPYGHDVWLRADLDFHHAIAAATGNGYIVAFLDFVSGRVRESILAAGRRQRPDDMTQLTIAEHRDLLAAIERGDGVMAEQAMRRHLHAAAMRIGLSAPSDRV